jgi:hypothetical protein
MISPDIQFTDDGSSKWAGMGDYILVSPNQAHRIELIYAGEPPHGDSFHHGKINGTAFPGYLWGCMFAFSSCSRYAVFSWMLKLYDRQTVVVDIQTKRYFVLPEYLYDFNVHWPSIIGIGKLWSSKQYSFSGHEHWFSY